MGSVRVIGRLSPAGGLAERLASLYWEDGYTVPFSDLGSAIRADLIARMEHVLRSDAP